MLGKTPPHIRAIRPLSHGVISDFEVTQELLTYLIHKAGRLDEALRAARVVGVPTGVTNVESRAVRDAALTAGAREVYIVEEPMAGAIGSKLPVKDAVGTMVLDIGAGTTDIAVHALGGTVSSKSTQVAGDRFNENIIDFVRSEFSLAIGERTAEDTKIAIGAVLPLGEELSRPHPRPRPRHGLAARGHPNLEPRARSARACARQPHGVDEGRHRAYAARAPFRRARARRDGLRRRRAPARPPGAAFEDARRAGACRGGAADGRRARHGVITENPRAWEEVFMHEQAILPQA